MKSEAERAAKDPIDRVEAFKRATKLWRMREGRKANRRLCEVESSSSSCWMEREGEFKREESDEGSERRDCIKRGMKEYMGTIDKRSGWTVNGLEKRGGEL